MKANNKIIAEFMGCTHPFNEVTDATLYKVSHGTFEASELKYDTSWDWLMPVVKKCLIGQTEVSRGLTNTNVSHILDALCYQDISRTYKAVLTFIKDYNDGKDK